MTTDPRTLVDRLLRGVSGNHVATVRDAWRDLLRQGRASVAAVRERLYTIAWADPWEDAGEINSSRLMTEYLGILLALLHELDPAIFRDEIDRLSNAELNPVHRRTVEFLSRRCPEAPVASIGPGIPVYVSDDIADKSKVIDYLRKWSRTRDLGLEDVTRIDVIAANPQLDYLGRYQVRFSGIVLTWQSDQVKSFRIWLQDLVNEITFYHEVGHHACGHVEGGQDPEQEREANRYAWKMLKNARPFTYLGLRIVRIPFRFMAKLVLRRIKKRR
jgi:hypothetical protein